MLHLYQLYLLRPVTGETRFRRFNVDLCHRFFVLVFVNLSFCEILFIYDFEAPGKLVTWVYHFY